VFAASSIWLEAVGETVEGCDRHVYPLASVSVQHNSSSEMLDSFFAPNVGKK